MYYVHGIYNSYDYVYVDLSPYNHKNIADAELLMHVIDSITCYWLYIRFIL